MGGPITPSITTVDGSEIRRSPVEVGSSNPTSYKAFLYIQTVVVWEIFHQINGVITPISGAGL